ncbi:MAG: MmcQ/YjbR family DNA-binding protein [Pseudomonadales bacterium]
MAKGGTTIDAAVQALCLAWPDTDVKRSHGAPTFRVRGRTFANLAINHHGDGRVALWLAAPPGAQQHWTEREPDQYFVPPYVGPRGWLGVHLDRGLDWRQIVERVREAYLQVAPPRLAAQLGPSPEIAAPDLGIDPALFDPLDTPRAREVLGKVRAFCLALPEAREARQFGAPCWQAGRRTFCVAHRYHGRMALQMRVGAEHQTQLTLDERFHIPDYVGHNGWISLDVEDGFWPEEVEQLILVSYAHFALKRMLKALPDGLRARLPGEPR